jgi:hypothetical protein
MTPSSEGKFFFMILPSGAILKSIKRWKGLAYETV